MPTSTRKRERRSFAGSAELSAHVFWNQSPAIFHFRVRVADCSGPCAPLAISPAAVANSPSAIYAAEMSTSVPEVFKLFSLHRYFLWSLVMRDHYERTGQRVSPTPSFFENEAANEAFMYLSYWYAGLYVVCEGWQDLKLSDPEINPLLSSPHLETLKRFRNGVYHFQSDYFDKRFMFALVLGPEFDNWVIALANAFIRYFDAWINNQTGALAQSQP